ncbi:up-regulator of cell proliferation-like [Lithobates pipiens]
MSSPEEVSWTLRYLRDKLVEIFEEDVDGLCDELDSLHLLSLEEYMDLQYDEDPGVRTEKMIDIILQKGEEASNKLLEHFNNMTVRFPALSKLPEFLYEEKKNKFQDLVEQLDMKKHLSSKITLRDILSIGSENLKEVELYNFEEIPWHFLRNLMALTRTSRNTQLKKDPTTLESNDDDDTFDIFQAENVKSNTIHPLDVLCVLLHCSDSFLQQEIVTKMSMCQFAVPLILPSPGDGSHCTFLLWAMRGIVKKWRPQSLTGSKGFREENVVNTSMPIFSFARLGKDKLSKSKILNQILNPAQQHHNFFIYHDMEGGNIKRKISDGLVEMSWYFPCGSSDVFPEPIAVTNLRGDLETNWEQFMFLTQISSAVFIFVENISESQFRLLSTCNDTDTQYYFIVTPGPGRKINSETQTFLKHIMETLKITKKQIIAQRNDSNEAEFVKKIQNIFKSLLSTEIQQLSLETVKKQTYGLQIDVDENNPECQKARACACNITSAIKGVEVFKKEMLKLQGDLWKQLSKVEKELCRMTKQGKVGTEEYQSQLKQQRISLHREQNQHSLTDAMILFINAITHLSQVEKQYFLMWMKFELDLIARRNMSALQVEYREKCKSSSDNPEELKQVDQKISDSSLGIEHFLRELGQFYEAECSMVKEEIISVERAQFRGLSGIAADLLLDGFPLELIDGDASNIALKWITDVLTELDTKTGGGCRIRVITVLGVQSTGKSTLLNTMFGLQFPVASGRCTRGAFMTLLNVKENFKEELGCDFILVIDTEGLKAPELASLEDSYEHDNELATLVVGLSDITIVNMAMENTAEMKDILQIVVHAFLRMKEVGKKPNCQFVHQNVSDVSAYEKNMRDRKKLLEQLDEMTKVAAKMEKKSGITSFNDVLDYDLDKHSWYIPGLWRGVPPMAPVNSGYSENVHNLKQHLFELMKSQNASCSISEFITWIESLWRAVKHEKFIFSFRNSLVADAYNKLSIQFSLWEWEFSKKVYNFVIRTENNIKNQSAENLDTETCEEYRRELQQLSFVEENKMLALLEKYYDNNDENVHLVERYREDFRLSVHFLRKELERNALNKCTKAISIQKGKYKIQNIQNQYQQLIEEKISDLLKNCRELNFKLNNEEIQQEFELMWEKTLKDLQIKKLDRLNVGQAILQHLRSDLSSKGSAVHEELKRVKNPASHGQRTFKMTKKYIDCSVWNYFKQSLGFDKQTSEMIEAFAVSLTDMCDKYIKEKVDTAEDYDDTYCQELLYMINTQLGNTTGLSFSVHFELDVKLIIFGNAAQMFQKMHDKFLKNNDPIACLESLKPQYLSIFLSIFQEKDESLNRARQFCERCLKPAMTDYVFKHLGEKIVDDILNSSESIIFSSRCFFQYNMLEKLLEEMSFQKYVEYIKSCKTFSESWILDYIYEKYDDSVTLENLYGKIVSSIKTEIQTVLEDKACLQSPDVSSFLENVCEMLQKELVIPQNEMKVITFHNTAAVEQLSSAIQHFLTETEQQILTELTYMDVEDILSKVTLKPQCELFRKVVGCGQQCPFCGTPCEAGGGDHKEHFSSIHRSLGLGKCIWLHDSTLVIDICSTLVVSTAAFQNFVTRFQFHPYKEYRTYYPDWAIQPDPSIESSDYWKYIFVQFNKRFAEEYRTKPAKLPKDWKKITKTQALDSIKKVFNVN